MVRCRIFRTVIYRLLLLYFRLRNSRCRYILL
nr:MAG TPA: hypothetical protein [Bacteriophage sp.]